LDGVVWGTSEIGGDPGGGLVNTPNPCGLGTVNYPGAIQFCNGALSTTVQNNGANDLQMYPRQPFDFAGRTGTIVFNVSNDDNNVKNADGQYVDDSWPELWVTDQPVPSPFIFPGGTLSTPVNGFDIRFKGCTDSSGNANTCPGGNQTSGVNSSAPVVTNGVVQNSTAYGDQSVTASGPGQQNHYQIEVSATQIDVYGTNAFTGTWNPAVNPLVHISTIKGFGTLGFTRGLVRLEHIGYNSNQPIPFEPNVNNTMTWGDVGFDGPVLARDLGFDVPANPTPSVYNSGPNSGPGIENSYPVPANGDLPLTVPDVSAAGLSAASGAILVFNYWTESVQPITGLFNANSFSAPYPADGVVDSPRTIAIPIPLSEITAGNNRVDFTTGSDIFYVSNIDLILLGAGGVVQPTS
jgi:hypothetical protein